MTTLPDFESGIYAQLSADSTITTWATGDIWPDDVPDGIEPPYVVFYEASFINERLTIPDMFSSVYRVEAVADNAQDANTGIELLAASLHKANLTISGFNPYLCLVTGKQHFIDSDGAAKLFRRVIDVEIRASNSQ